MIYMQLLSTYRLCCNINVSSDLSMHNVFSGVEADHAQRAVDCFNLQLAKVSGLLAPIIYHAGWVLKNGYRLHCVPASTLPTDDRNDRLSKSFRSSPKFMRVISVVTK